jgi:hypothetical protein
LTQKNPQPGEDSSEVVADGGEDGVGGIAGAVFEIAAAEVKQPDWDGVNVVFWTSVTIGLIALYVFVK